MLGTKSEPHLRISGAVSPALPQQIGKVRVKSSHKDHQQIFKKLAFNRILSAESISWTRHINVGSLAKPIMNLLA
jgi:hypothetical protein